MAGPDRPRTPAVVRVSDVGGILLVGGVEPPAMTSLAEVYAGARNESLRRLYLGTGLFATGTLMTAVALVAASTRVLVPLGVGVLGARELAGVLGGLGVPAVFVGIFTVLPASDRERAVAAVGAAIAVVGVVLFWLTYPQQWITASADHLTLPVTIVYFAGLLVTFWSLFVAVVNFKTRNDPGGTVTLERTIGGRTQRVEVPVSELQGRNVADLGGLGGVGVFGDLDREPVLRGGSDAPQDDAVVERASSSRRDRPGPSTGSTPASDGGTQAEILRTPGTATRTPTQAANPDRYCGNCRHFDYVNGDDGIQPYCGFTDDLMDDMTPCSSWSPNVSR